MHKLVMEKCGNGGGGGKNAQLLSSQRQRTVKKGGRGEWIYRIIFFLQIGSDQATNTRHNNNKCKKSLNSI